MSDLEVYKEIVIFYTQGVVSDVEEARRFVIELMEENENLKDVIKRKVWIVKLR